MASYTASRKSTARRALYFARRRTDRSLTALQSTSGTPADVWNALSDHRSSVHSSAADDAVLTQLQFYSDAVDLVASTSRRPSSSSSKEEEQQQEVALTPSSISQLVDVSRPFRPWYINRLRGPLCSTYACHSFPFRSSPASV